MTRALLLAPAGMVGRAFASVLDADADVTWEGLDRTRLDLADEVTENAVLLQVPVWDDGAWSWAPQP